MTEPNQTPPPPRAWMRAALVVSLTLNVLVLGFLLGAVVKGPPPGRELREASFGPFSDALTREDRRALRQAFAARGGDLRQARADQRAELAQMIALLRAEPLDREALRALLDSGAARAAARQDLGRDLILNHLISLDAAARRTFADRLEAGPDRRRPGGSGG